jgi:hypothetical protein
VVTCFFHIAAPQSLAPNVSTAQLFWHQPARPSHDTKLSRNAGHMYRKSYCFYTNSHSTFALHSGPTHLVGPLHAWEILNQSGVPLGQFDRCGVSWRYLDVLASMLIISSFPSSAIGTCVWHLLLPYQITSRCLHHCWHTQSHHCWGLCPSVSISSWTAEQHDPVLSNFPQWTSLPWTLVYTNWLRSMLVDDSVSNQRKPARQHILLSCRDCNNREAPRLQDAESHCLLSSWYPGNKD